MRGSFPCEQLHRWPVYLTMLRLYFGTVILPQVVFVSVTVLCMVFHSPSIFPTRLLNLIRYSWYLASILLHMILCFLHSSGYFLQQWSETAAPMCMSVPC